MNQEIKSPFLVIQDVISPLLSEQIIDVVDFVYPDTDVDGRPVRTVKGHEAAELLVFEKFMEHVPTVENYFNVQYRGTIPMLFEWYVEGSEGEKPHCENSNYVNKKWVKFRDYDLSCVLFLCDYQEQTPFDSDFEVYGGKLEFTQHQFGFNPQRGTVVIFPSGPYFINNTSSIRAGDLFQIRFHISTMKQFKYDPNDYPGDFTVWFDHLA